MRESNTDTGNGDAGDIALGHTAIRRIGGKSVRTGPCVGDTCVHDTCVHDTCVHDTCVHDTCVHDTCVHEPCSGDFGSSGIRTGVGRRSDDRAGGGEGDPARGG